MIDLARMDVGSNGMSCLGRFSKPGQNEFQLVRIGCNIANREKMMIIRAACRIYGVAIPGDLKIELPNA